MKKVALTLVSLMASVEPAAVWAQGAKYPPFSEYMMASDAEVALARSAAPDQVSAHATIKILTASGYQVAAQGDSGFVCMVLRGWSAPTFTPAQSREGVYYAKLRAPICFDPIATRTLLPYQELRAKLGMEGKDPDAIAREVATAYARGELPKMEGVAFAYMWSAEQDLGPGVGAWHPHMMVYAPYDTNSMLGNNEFGGSFAFVADDAGTPFSVVVIPVHGIAAIGSKTAPLHKP